MMKMVGNYQLGETIGKGAYGTVYKALNLATGDFVAIKQIRLGEVAKDQISGIEGEIDLLSKLRHPNIVKYLGHNRAKDSLYIVLEYVESGSLQTIIKKFGKIPETLAAVYIGQVLEGLVYLHEQGVIHRDIKGGNILTTKTGLVKLADFGVATKITAGKEQARETDVVGSPYWMAPEIIELSGPSPASDVWSVGCTIIELLTGAPPYFHLAPMPALFHIVQDDHPPLPEGISSALRDFLLQCFQKELSLRPQAAQLLKHPWLRGHTNKRSTLTMTPGMGLLTSAIVTSPPAAAPSTAALQIPAPTGPASAPVSPRTTISSVQTSTSSPPGAVPAAAAPANSAVPASVAPTKPAVIEKPRMPQQPQTQSTTTTSSTTMSVPILPHLTTLTPLKPATLPVDFMDGFSDDDDPPPKATAPQPTDTTVKKKKRSLASFRDTDDDSSFDSFVEQSATLTKSANGDAGEFAEKLKAKMSRQWDSASKEQVVDIFAEVLDDTFDQEAFEARELAAQRHAEIVRLMNSVQNETQEAPALATLARLHTLFEESEQRSMLVRHQGVSPIIELLQVNINGSAAVLSKVLSVVNSIVSQHPAIQESLCLVGALPSILKHTKNEDPAVRNEVAIFLSQMCRTSVLTLQMLIACRGLVALVEFLEPSDERIKYMAVDGILRVFQLQTHTPKNDFCRIFIKSGLLPRLVSGLYHSLVCSLTTPPTQDSLLAKQYVDKMVSILLIFSTADSVVKSSVAAVAEVLFKMIENFPEDQQIRLLKAIKNISMDANTLSQLSHPTAFSVLVSVLAQREGPHAAEMTNQALSTLFNLCRIDRHRQECAAAAGAIPHLRYFSENPTLKQLSLPLLCEMAHSPSPVVRSHLWANDILSFYLQMFSQRYWKVNAVEAISVWLQEETKKVEVILAHPSNADRFVGLLLLSADNVLEKIVEPLATMLTCSPTFARALSSTAFFSVLLGRADQPQAIVRVQILRMIAVLFERCERPKQKAEEVGLRSAVEKLKVKYADGVLVQEICTQLLAGVAAAEQTADAAVSTT